MVTTDFGSRDAASSIVLQADGKFVVGGDSGFAEPHGLCCCPLHVGRHPRLDVRRRRQGDDERRELRQLLALALQGDGKIAAAGTGHERSEFAVVRYEPDGGLDMTFDEDGMLTTNSVARWASSSRPRVSRSKQTARSSSRASQSWMTISATSQSHATTRTAASTQAC